MTASPLAPIVRHLVADTAKKPWIAGMMFAENLVESAEFQTGE